jgi:hypothetical protein
MASEHYNPSLRQLSRSDKAPILPSSGETSILEWLENIGRLRALDPQEIADEEAENEEISDLMAGEDDYEEEEDDLSLDDDD